MSCHGRAAKKAAQHLKTYLLLYSLAAIALGLAAGLHWHTYIKSHRSLVKNTIIVLAILTIYPSMVQLKPGKLAEAGRKAKPVTIGVAMVFIVSPLLAMLLSRLLPEASVATGYVLVNLVPASSAALGYVLISGGSVELATILILIAIAGSFASIPGYLALYSRVSHIAIPAKTIAESLGITLLLPLILGQLTRYMIIHRRAWSELRGAGDGNGYPCLSRRVSGGLSEALKALHEAKRCIEARLEASIKPHLSLTTMTSMLILIALLVAAKAEFIIEKPLLAMEVFALQGALLATLLTLLTILDPRLGISYEDHTAIAFISSTRNAGVAAAIAVSALSAAAALPAALVPVIQAPIAITYVQLSGRVKAFFAGGTAGARAAPLASPRGSGEQDA